MRVELRIYQMELCATRDAVTGLLSGVQFRRVALPSAVKAHTSLALLYLDVDGLKRVNDTQGHAAGDRLLVACARVLAAVCLSAGGMPFRLHGGEFTVLLPGSDSKKVRAYAHRILLELRRRQITASIGGAATDRVPAARLLDEAETAMRRAKAAGKARAALATGRLSQRAMARCANETERGTKCTAGTRVVRDSGAGLTSRDFIDEEVRS